MKTLALREQELRKRWVYPYRWGRVQNNQFDALTRFVYRIESFDAVLTQIERRYAHAPDYDGLRNYALNRWYNFWSARAIEDVFCSLEEVVPARNRRDRLVDFVIQGVRFDHKTSVFPKGFGRDLCFAVNRPEVLIRWLYSNQSKQQRQHYANRLFVVLYAADGHHWKLKAELTWLRGLVTSYVMAFEPSRLWEFPFGSAAAPAGVAAAPAGVADALTLADIIWAIRV